VTKLVVIIGFAVAFAAGLTVGMKSQQASIASPAAPASPTSRPSGPRHGGWMTSELNLTPQQQEQLDKIWSDSRSKMHDMDDKRRQLRADRDEAFIALLSPENKIKYDEAVTKYKEQSAAIDAAMRKNFEDSVARTKEVLTADQRAKYDEWLSHHQPGDRGPDGHNRGDRSNSNNNSGTRRADAAAGATSRPSNQP
jgi:Spy/CpxP family protein refolding chaperone